MCSNNLFSRIGTIAFALVLLLVAAGEYSWASGTAAGTGITSTATVSYNDQNSNPRTPVSGSVTIYVAQKIVINFTPSGSPNRIEKTVDNVTRDYAFTITNGGNGTDIYSYETYNQNGWTISLRDSANTGSLASDSINADASLYGYVRIAIPAGETDTDTNTVIFKVTSAKTGGGGNPVVANAGTSGSFYVRVVIRKPVLSFTVSQSPSTNKIPGDAASYTVSISNTGSGRATSASVSMKMHDSLTFVSAPGTDNLSASITGSDSSGTITWTLGTLDSANSSGTRKSVTLTLNTTISQTSYNGTGIPSGTVIRANDTTNSPSTPLSMTYNDGDHNYYQVPSSGALSFTVGTASGVNIALRTSHLGNSYPLEQTVDRGSTATFYITLKNMGNHTDSYTFSRVVTSVADTFMATSIKYFNASGDFNASYSERTDTTLNADSTYFTVSSVAQGESVYVRIEVLVSTDQRVSGGAYMVNAIHASTTTSSPIDPNGSQSFHTVTGLKVTVSAPVLSVTLSVEGLGVGAVGTTSNPAPGDTVWFLISISNSGNGNATSVVVSNPINGNMTFASDWFGSGYGIQIKIVGGSATAQTNASDSDDAKFASGAVQTESSFTVSAGQAKEIRYRAVVN